jgi:hypothetical protein
MKLAPLLFAPGATLKRFPNVAPTLIGVAISGKLTELRISKAKEEAPMKEQAPMNQATRLE